MIRTLGDMLEDLRRAEAKRLGEVDIKHPPTIGEMYEGLTQDLLGRAIPSGLDLKVVSGFAIDGNGGTTGQLDCMVVRGKGIPIPYAPGKFQWHVRDVLAVFEVKKTLFGGDLGDAYQQLKSVSEITSAWLQKAKGTYEFSLGASMRAYAQCTGEIAPPADEWLSMDPARHLIFHTIMFDQIAPVRVMLGYFGYSTEGGLRRGFSSLLEQNSRVHGFGPPTLPNLIVADGAALVKLGGHPYHHPLKSDGYWPILASSHINPTLLILELIWTRISYLQRMAELFGEDLELELLSQFLEARPVIPVRSEDAQGWMYREIPLSAKQLAEGPDHMEWAPVELDVQQNVVLDQLCREDVFTTEPDLVTYLKSSGRDPETFFQSLIETNLVAMDGTRLILTTVQLAIVILPDCRTVAADNNTGRLERWVQRFMGRRDEIGGEYPNPK